MGFPFVHINKKDSKNIAFTVLKARPRTRTSTSRCRTVDGTCFPMLRGVVDGCRAAIDSVGRYIILLDANLLTSTMCSVKVGGSSCEQSMLADC